MSGKIGRLQIPDAKEFAADQGLPEFVVYEHAGFGGQSYRSNLNVVYFAQDSFWNDQISSIVVVRGRWEFFVDSYFHGQSVILGPGYYSDPGAIGLPNDSISSVRLAG